MSPVSPVTNDIVCAMRTVFLVGAVCISLSLGLLFGVRDGEDPLLVAVAIGASVGMLLAGGAATVAVVADRLHEERTSKIDSKPISGDTMHDARSSKNAATCLAKPV